MSKYKTDLSYIKRCGYCHNDERFTLRASNVNTSITDDDAARIAMNSVGDTGSGYCENCKMITQHTTVAYDLPEAE